MDKTSSLFFEMPLGRHLSVLTKLYFGALTKRLEELEIERHYSILILVEKNPGKCTQQYISDFLKIDKASMVRIIDFLVKKKYIKRTVNINDRRERKMELTAKAEKIMSTIHQGIQEINKAATTGLSAKELEIFNTAIQKIHDNLSKIPSSRVIVNFKKAKVFSK